MARLHQYLLHTIIKEVVVENIVIVVEGVASCAASHHSHCLSLYRTCIDGRKTLSPCSSCPVLASSHRASDIRTVSAHLSLANISRCADEVTRVTCQTAVLVCEFDPNVKSLNGAVLGAFN